LRPGHRDATGVYFAYGNSAMDVNGLVTNAAATGYVANRTGTVDLNAYSGGVYWTHYGPSGWYLDAVLQGTAYTGDATTQFANLQTDGSGIITSLEAGYPVPLPLGRASCWSHRGKSSGSIQASARPMTGSARWRSVQPRARRDGSACAASGP
jgi:outer membrane autotransporter protein